MQRKKSSAGAIVRSAPDEAFIAYARTKAREAEAELEKRLSNCDPLLVELAEQKVKPSFDLHPSIPYVNLSPELK